MAAYQVTAFDAALKSHLFTITQDATTQSLYDYYQYQLAQAANMPYAQELIRAGDSFDLADWDMTVDGCDSVVATALRAAYDAL